MRTMRNVRVVVAAFALSAAGGAVADNNRNDCRVHTLDGLYVFSATGYTIVAGVAEPKSITELIHFNGDGTLTVPGATRSVNGTIFRSPANGGGSYALDPDCIGSLAFTNGPSFDIFVSPQGEKLWMIQTNDGSVFQGNVTRIGR